MHVQPMQNRRAPEHWHSQKSGGQRGRVREGVCVMRRRRASLSSADQAATRRVVQGIFGRVAATQGKGLGEVRLCTHLH